MKDKQIPLEISFKWNPHGDDYPDYVSVYINQYFIYEENEPSNWQVLQADEIKKEWYICET